MAKSSIRRLAVGARVFINERVHTILEVLSIEEVRVLDREANETRVAQTVEIHGMANPATGSGVETPDAIWLEAERRYDLVRPLLEPGRTYEMVEELARREGKSVVTIYRWIARVESSGSMLSLLHRERSDKGAHRLKNEVEQLIDQVVQSDYMTDQRKSVKTVIIKVRGLCSKHKLPLPHGNTIRNRIDELEKELKLTKRHGAKKARETVGPVRARTREPEGPWAVMEMDNWNPDIVLVDDVQRKPLGRPWVTLAIDEYSKMVLGFYVSFDKPSALGTGLCLVHAALRKSEWLVKHDIDAEWPCFGLPKRILSDNGSEFQNKMLLRACKEIGIDQDFRPQGRPNYGGIIERLFRTLNSAVHELPGTTFSNSKDKGDYDSNKKSAMSLFEFERWLGIYILKVYHERSADELKMSPREKFDQGILGTRGSFATGLFREVEDTKQFRMNFMPFVHRTVQRTGVQIENIDYWEDTLRKWIDAPDPANKKLKRKFLFRTDPRDIHLIWFENPDTREYDEIGYRDKTHPPISRWELREILNRYARKGEKRVDEQMIFAAYEEMDALGTTRKLRQKKLDSPRSAVKSILRRHR